MFIYGVWFCYYVTSLAVHVPSGCLLQDLQTCRVSYRNIHWGDTWSSFSSATAFQRVYGETRHAALLRQKSHHCLEMHSRRSSRYEYFLWFWCLAGFSILVLLSMGCHRFFFPICQAKRKSMGKAKHVIFRKMIFLYFTPLMKVIWNLAFSVLSCFRQLKFSCLGFFSNSQLCLWGFYRAGHIVTSPCAIAAQYLRRVCFDMFRLWALGRIQYDTVILDYIGLYWIHSLKHILVSGSCIRLTRPHPLHCFPIFPDSWISLVGHLWCFITKDMGSEITNKHALPVFSHFSHFSPLVHCFRKKTAALGLLSLVPSHSWFHIVLFLPTGWTIYIIVYMYVYNLLCEYNIKESDDAD